MAKPRISVTLEIDIVQSVKELAEYDGRPFAQYVNLVLRDHLENLNEPLSDRTKKSKTTSVGLTLDANVIERIQQLAADNHRSVSQYINIVLRQHLNRQKEI